MCDFLRDGAGDDVLNRLMQTAPNLLRQPLNGHLQDVGQTIANPLLQHEIDPAEELTGDALGDFGMQTFPITCTEAWR